MDYYLIIDILGVIAFSISGVLSSMKKKMDPFGILIIAFVTSVGGGTLRDILIGFPVAWMRNLTYVHVILATTVFAIIFRKKLIFLRRSLFLFDTVGIGLYTIIGVEKGISADFPPIICIADEGWSITTHSYFNDHPNAYTGGNHGYDPINRSMHGSFIASDPAFKEGLSVNSFLNIHTYDLIAHIMELNPTENDGHFDSVSVMLK